MRLKPSGITFDSKDPIRIATWWAEQIGCELGDTDGVNFQALKLPETMSPVGFAKVDEPTPGKNKAHLEFAVADLDRAATELVAAGASEIARHDFGEGWRWIVLADPDDNQFCIFQEPVDG